jgi:2'-phosphotransferase
MRTSNNNCHIGKQTKRPPATKQVKTSKSLSWALRHAGPDIGLFMTPDGYVPVKQLLTKRHPKLHLQDITLRDIEDIVAGNDKQRFHMDWRPLCNYPDFIVADEETSTINNVSGTILCIRASQGHSISFIDSDLLLTPLCREELALLPVIVHGTFQEPWETGISKRGLCKMNRNHIHLAPGFPDAKDGVISGMRQTCGIYIFIDAKKCASNPAIIFYRSANGVLLTAGLDGMLPVEYFSHVTDSKGNVLLDNRKEAGAGDKTDNISEHG